MLEVEQAVAAAALAELKAHLRLDEGAEDALLSGWLRAATEAVELELGQLLIERGVEEIATVRFGAARPVLAPVREVEGADFEDAGGAWVPVDAYVLKRAPTRLIFSGVVDGAQVRLRYRAGLGTGWNGLPEILRQAVVRLAAHFHTHRDAPDVAAMPPAVRQLLAPLRTRRLR